MFLKELYQKAFCFSWKSACVCMDHSVSLVILYPPAPILMLCPQNDIELRKALEISLPLITDASEINAEALGIQVIKS